MGKKIAVVLSGCGFQDGAEVTESVSTLIALGNSGAQYQCFAPDISFASIDHYSGSPGESRNTLSESARICRGKIQPLSELRPENFDGLVIPGGFGAALHLSDWAQKGSDCKVHSGVENIVQNFHKESKPIGAICIAPTLIAKVLGSHNITLTIGNDVETAKEIEKTGALHEVCAVDDYITDREHKLVTTPGYMYDDAPPYLVFKGISGLVKELVEMA